MSFSMESRLPRTPRCSDFQGSWISERYPQAGKPKNREGRGAEMQAVRVNWGYHKGRPITGSAASQKCYMFLFIFIPIKIISFAFGFFFFFDRGRSLDIWLSCLVSKHLDFQDIFVLLIFILILLWTESILWFKHSNIFDCVYWQNLWPMVVKCLCDLECESWVLGERVPTGQLGQVRGQCVLMCYLSNLLSNPERCSGLQL